MACFVML